MEACGLWYRGTSIRPTRNDELSQSFGQYPNMSGGSMDVVPCTFVLTPWPENVHIRRRPTANQPHLPDSRKRSIICICSTWNGHCHPNTWSLRPLFRVLDFRSMSRWKAHYGEWIQLHRTAVGVVTGSGLYIALARGDFIIHELKIHASVDWAFQKNLTIVYSILIRHHIECRLC